MKKIPIALAIAITTQILFAQEFDDDDEEEESEQPSAIVAASPKPMSVSQALSSSGLPRGCTEDFTNLMEKDGFNMAKFMKDLPADVAKTKVMLKSPFGKPKDGDRTSSGVTVGCIKALPESPAGIASMLRNINLNMGLDSAVDAATSVASNSIPANIPKESGSGGGMFGTISAISLATGGLGTIIYGITQNGEVTRHVSNRDGKAAVDAESRRNMSYGIGAGLLAGGLVIHLVF